MQDDDVGDIYDKFDKIPFAYFTENFLHKSTLQFIELCTSKVSSYIFSFFLLLFLIFT